MLWTGVQWPEKMIPKLFAALLALCLLASVVLAADKPISDDLLYDQVRIKLAGDAEVKGGALKVDVKQGVVTIGGTVETQRQKDKAAKLAKKVKGVKQVVNNLVLKDK
jgi:hyperosmotically inducible periplasmic protein